MAMMMVVGTMKGGMGRVDAFKRLHAEI